MPHASLLGSIGHHCAFTSQMISGHINVFIVLQEEGCVGEKGKERQRNTKIPCIRTRLRAHGAPSLKDVTLEEGIKKKKKGKRKKTLTHRLLLARTRLMPCARQRAADKLKISTI